MTASTTSALATASTGYLRHHQRVRHLSGAHLGALRGLADGGPYALCHVHQFRQRTGGHRRRRLGGPLTFLFVFPLRDRPGKKPASRLAGLRPQQHRRGHGQCASGTKPGGNKRESERFAKASDDSFRKFRAEALIKLLFGHAGSMAF